MSFLYAPFLWLLIPLFVYLFKRETKQSFVQNLRWFVFALLLVALARPVLPKTLGVERIKAHSLVLALDLSASMNADDIKPSRALASKEIIRQFFLSNKNDQIALMGFTSNPLILSPPTTDHELLLVALDNINSQYILTKGTNLTKLFKKIAQFNVEEKQVILFTDGGDEAIDESLLSWVQEEKIKILVIATATPEGSSLKDKNGNLLESKEGKIVISKLNDSLRILAQESGGRFIEFSTISKTLAELEAWLSKEEHLSGGLNKEAKQYVELAFIPMFLALVLFFISTTKFSKKLLILFLFFGLNLEAKAFSVLDAYYLHQAYGEYKEKSFKKSQNYLYKIAHRSLEAELLLAHVLYREEKYKEAKSVLKKIKSSNRKIKQQLLYELGNCEAKMAYMNKAKRYYVHSLQLGEDDDVYHNLQLVLFQIQKKSLTLGHTNLSKATSSKGNKNLDKEDALEEEKSKATKSKGMASSTGGSGSKKSKGSTLQIMQKEYQKSHTKRVLSSKAYDLINEGYISEKNPW